MIVKGTENVSDMGTKALDGPTHQKLLAKLPLREPTCRRLVGLAAVTLAITAAEASEVVVRASNQVEAHAGGSGHFGWFWELVRTLVVAVCVACCIFRWFATRKQFRTVGVQTEEEVQTETRGPVTMATKSVQSPVTYTAVRKCINPRFLPLPEHSHGCP